MDKKDKGDWILDTPDCIEFATMLAKAVKQTGAKLAVNIENEIVSSLTPLPLSLVGAPMHARLHVDTYTLSRPAVPGSAHSWSQRHTLKGGKKAGTIVFGVGEPSMVKLKLPDKGVCMQVDAPKIDNPEGYRQSVRTSLRKRAASEQGSIAATPDLPSLAE